MLELRRLRLLTEFARRGTIAATADVLGYTASAVSQQLAALEREAGTPLLVRTGRSAELTDAGRRLVDHAGGILAAVEAAEADLTGPGEPRGRVPLSTFPTAALALAAPVVHRLRHHRGLRVPVRQAAPAEGIAMLRSGEVDIALVDEWPGAPLPRDEALHTEHLLTDPLVLIGDAGVPPGPAPTPEALAEAPWIAAPVHEPSRRALDAWFAGSGFRPRIGWEFQGLDTIVALAARGRGVALVPALAVGASAEVTVRPLADPAPVREVHAVVRRAAAGRRTVTVVLEALRAVVADLPRPR